MGNDQEKLSSSESSICKQSTESVDNFALRGPSSWANSLEKLLEDKEGIHVFAVRVFYLFCKNIRYKCCFYRNS